MTDETHAIEAGCDFELDGPDRMSDLPIEERLGAWMAWAGYLKQRIRDHYRPRIAALEDELATAKRLNGQWMDEKTAALMRAEKAEAELDEMSRAWHESDEHKAADELRGLLGECEDKLVEAEAKLAAKERIIADLKRIVGRQEAELGALEMRVRELELTP